MLVIEGTALALAWTISLTPAEPATELTPTPTPATAPAAPTKPPPPKPRSLRDGPYHLDLRAQTDFPVSVGARINAELPYRLQLSTALGGLPGGYVDVINAVVVAAHGYDETTAGVIRGALSSSLVWRTHFGWRPLRRRGFYFEAGYGLVTLGGGITAEDVLVIATGSEAPPRRPGARELDYDVRSTLHMLDAEIGWRWLVWHDRIVIAAALGFSGTVAAKTVIEPRDASRVTDSDPLQALADEGESYLDGLYTKYVMTPVVTVGVGYRFF